MTSKPIEAIKLPGWLAFVARLGGGVSPKQPDRSPEDGGRLGVYSRVDGPPRRAEKTRRKQVRLFAGDRRVYVHPHHVSVDHLASGSFVMQQIPSWSAYFKQLTVPVGQQGSVASSTDRRVMNILRYEQLTMGVWGFYFLAKLGMYWSEMIDFHAFENLLFAAFIFFPVRSRSLRWAKNIVTGVVATALLYYDSWSPPIVRLISQASLLAEFNAAYLGELLARFISWPVIGALLAAGLLYWMASRRLRMSVLVFACMLVVGVIQSPFPHWIAHLVGWNVDGDNDHLHMTGAVQEFFHDESRRVVNFVKPAPDAVPFDVIFIHVCSLSWDDVQAVGLDDHPLWARFDMLLTKFNSAASYSGPAAIHMLRSGCGQQEHTSLYVPTEAKCYLMNNLKNAGFESELALNHDGRFDGFLGQLRKHGRLTAPLMPLDGVKITQYAFDGEPVYDDLSVFNRWLDKRERSGSRRVALYYNTISLHDGNHYQGDESKPNTLQTYRSRLSGFLDSVESILQEVERSGQRAVVVMIPEHGGAVRGDKQQIAGLREIPTPAITIVPVGIKVVGGKALRKGDALIIDQPSSYLAVSYIIGRMLEKSPFQTPAFTPSDYIEGLPFTPFVAQNEQVTVAEYNYRYYLSRNGKDWKNYAEFNQFVDKK